MLPAAHPARPLRRLLPAALLVAAALLSAQFAMTDSSQAALPGATGFGVATGGGIQDEDATTQARDLDLIRDVGANVGTPGKVELEPQAGDHLAVHGLVTGHLPTNRHHVK